VFILSDRIPNGDVNGQLRGFRAEVVVCKKTFDTVFVNISNHAINRWSNLVFYRLLIPFIPQLRGYDRILYVDTDTMFIKDFGFLMDMPMDYMYGMFYEEHHCEKYGKWLHERLLAAYDLVRRHNYAPMRIS
jgi:lipopolysaccharide biosynthesis glycosyltransferase